MFLTDGSSPQVRGKCQGREGRLRGHRLIPAGAGKMWNLQLAWARGTAHPRRCGENRLALERHR